MNKNYTEITKNRQYLPDVVPLDMPYALFIDPTNHCNFHCSFCPRNLPQFKQFAGEYQHMPLELFEKILADIRAFPRRLKTVRLYFLGEPLLSPNFLAMFSELCESNCCDRIEVTTNGSLMTPDKAERLLESTRSFEGDVYFRFSIYAVGQSHFEMVTKNKLDVRKVWNNIKGMYEIRNKGGYENVSLYAKKLRTLDEEDNEFLQLYAPVVDEAALEEPMNWSGDGGEENFLLKEEYSESKIAQIMNQTDFPRVCSYLFTTMAINSDGEVVACCVDWSRKTKYGNVKTESLSNIWNGEELRNLRLLHLQGKRGENNACANCRRMPLNSTDRLDGYAEEIIARL